jgi:hypothetical protein
MATAPRLVTLIKKDLESLPKGDTVLFQIRGKFVQSHLKSKNVSMYLRQSQTTKNVILENPVRLTGEVLVLDGATEFAYAKTMNGLWLDVTYLEMVLPPKKDNTTMYIFLLIGLSLILE